MKYEDTWSREKLKQQGKGWLWDSMIAAHILDNRPGVTGLKFPAKWIPTYNLPVKMEMLSIKYRICIIFLVAWKS